jgi:heptosyltransferase III
LSFLARFYIKTLKPHSKILIIVQRSNGDVFLSATLISELYKNFNSPQIDLLVNEDTYQVASLLPHINHIHTFSYNEKANNRWQQEKRLIISLYKKYDLSINLTSSDRSVIYSLFAGKKSISVVEKDPKKSWWKKLLLSSFYFYDQDQHILVQNLTPLKILKIKYDFIQCNIEVKSHTLENIKKKLNNRGIENFLIFHPSAQYKYKIYPKNLRDKLIENLNKLEVPILITGTNNEIDLEIKNSLPSFNNIYDFIGETSLEEFYVLSSLADAYIGMDTLNMHIASSQNKRIFAIFGPTKLSMWSPWSNLLKTSAQEDIPIQTYGDNTIFQADMPCVACGNAGCDNNHGKSDCLERIDPDLVFKEIQSWYQKKLTK